MHDPAGDVVVGPLALVAAALFAAAARRRSPALGAAACGVLALELGWTRYRRFVRDPRRADLRFLTVVRGQSGPRDFPYYNE